MLGVYNAQSVHAKRLRFVGWLRQKPAFLALSIQLVSAILALTLYCLCYNQGWETLSANTQWWIFVITQAFLASILTVLFHMPVWWRWINTAFPILVFLMLLVQVPDEIFLAGFLICLSLYWTVFQTRVPFYPSRPAIWKALLRLAEALPKQTQPKKIIDIGSGLGDLSMYLAKMRPRDTIEGIEIAPLPWLISQIRSMIHRSGARFIRGNYETLDFAEYDIVFAYLSPAAMPALWLKAQAEMRPGSLLVSLEFEVPGQAPDKVIYVPGKQPPLFIWTMSV